MQTHPKLANRRADRRIRYRSPDRRCLDRPVEPGMANRGQDHGASRFWTTRCGRRYSLSPPTFPRSRWRVHRPIAPVRQKLEARVINRALAARLLTGVEGMVKIGVFRKLELPTGHWVFRFLVWAPPVSSGLRRWSL